MDLDRVWMTTLTDLDGNDFGVSHAPGSGFGWHSPSMFDGGFSTAAHAARDLLERHGTRIGWQEGEAVLQRCRDHDFAREAQQAA